MDAFGYLMPPDTEIEIFLEVKAAVPARIKP